MGIKGVKTNNAVGVKGRSGRKTAREENAKLNTIILAWQKVLANIEKGDVEKIALPIALKDMTVKNKLDARLTLNFDNRLKDVGVAPETIRGITEQSQI